MTISKIFVQKHVSMDMEGRDWDWIDTDETYEELRAELKKGRWNWMDGARVVEKTFDDHTFKIEIKELEVIKTEWEDRNGQWKEILVEKKYH